jgi:O-antigen/teichoic acid export membrane protein
MKSEKVILYNTAYQVIGKVITAFLGVVMTFLMTRYLGASGFGQYNFVLAFVGMAYIFADFGLDPVLIRTRADGSLTAADFRTLFTFRLIILGILLVGTMGAAKYYFHYDSFITLGIGIAGVAHIFLMLSSTIWDLLKGSLEYQKIVLIQIVTSIIHCVLIGYGVYVQLSPVSFFAILMLGYVGSFLLSLKFSPFAVRIEIQLTNLRKYLVLAVPFILGVAVSIALSRLNILMLGNIYSPSTYPYVGYYSLGMRIFDVVILLGGYYANTLYPFLSQSKGKALQRDAFLRYGSYALGIALCVTAGMFVFARPFVTILAGPTFEPAIVITQILAFAGGLTILEGFLYSYLLAMGREKVWVTISVLTFALNLILNNIYIVTHSFIAVSWITVATHGFALLLSAGALLWIQARKA